MHVQRMSTHYHACVMKQGNDFGENTKDSGMRFIIHKILIATFGLLLIITEMSQCRN